MNAILSAFAQPWAERLGWALIHFVWQGALIALVFAVAAKLAGPNPARRYLLACVAMAAMLVALPATYLWLANSRGATPGARLPSLPITAAAIPGAPPDSPILLSQWLVLAWMAGVLAFSVRLMGGWWRARWLRRAKTRPAPPEWQRALDRLVAHMRVGRPVQLGISSAIDAPAAIGWLRPMILMPVGAITGLPSGYVEALFAHELAHILRRDYLVNLLQCLAEAVLFYHPAIWWISAQIRHERELCCDDLAVAASGDALAYAHALADLESFRPSRPQTVMAANGGSLLYRIARLAGQPQPSRHPLPAGGAAWVAGILLLAAIAALTIRGAHAQEATVNRSEIWVDTVKLGDMNREVRGLGTVKDANTVELRIAETHMKDVKAGQSVALDSRKGPLFTGVVTAIQTEPKNGTQGVEVHIPNAAPVPKGTQVDGIIEIEHLTNVLHVGRPVFGKPDSQMTLFKLEPDGKRAVRVTVEVGRTSVNLIEIRSGLQPGDKVILNDMEKYQGIDRITLK